MTKFKNIDKVVLVIAVIFTFLGNGIKNTKASSTITTGATIPYSYTVKQLDGHWSSSTQTYFIYVDGEIGFCIEPGIFLDTSASFVPSPYEWSALSIIAYEGWENSDKTAEDYLATQFMIWEVMGADILSTSFTDYARYKARIQERVDHHDDKPSFSNKEYNINIGETLRIHDVNEVIKDFHIEESAKIEGIDISIDKKNNDILITANRKFNAIQNIILNRYSLDCVGSSIAYRSDSSQDVAKFYLSDPNYAAIKLNVVSGKVKFEKNGEVFNRTLTSSNELGSYQEPLWEKQKILGAEFSIVAAEQIKDHSNNVLYEKDEVIEVIESTYDDDYSKDLPEGKYYGWESKVPFGYIEDLRRYDFAITASGGSNQIKTLEIYNGRAVQFFMFNKQMEEHSITKYRNPEAYKDVSFGIFARDDTYNYTGDVAINPDELIQTFIIDKDGQSQAARIEDDKNADGIISDDEISYLPFKTNLPIGNFYVKELTTNKDYLLDPTEYDFEVSYQGQGMQNITLAPNNGEPVTNKLRKVEIEVNKTDFYSGMPIINKQFGFSIYSDEKCTELVQNAVTDVVRGAAVFKDIESGTYWIKETKAPLGYIISEEAIKVVVDENTPLIDGVYHIVVPNQLMPSVATGDDNVLWVMLSTVFISGGFIIFLYSCKRKHHV